jgi:arylsulfatase A-like enzyme
MPRATHVEDEIRNLRSAGVFLGPPCGVPGLEPSPGLPLDGESLLPLLRQTGSLERDAIFFHYKNYAFHRENRLASAIREGNYKLILFYDDDSVELYDLAKDLSEEHDLSAAPPEKAAKMKARLVSWLQSSGAKMPRPR